MLDEEADVDDEGGRQRQNQTQAEPHRSHAPPLATGAEASGVEVTTPPRYEIQPGWRGRAGSSLLTRLRNSTSSEKRPVPMRATTRASAARARLSS